MSVANIKRSKTIKVTDAKTAMLLMELIINRAQKLENTVENMKNMGYLLQTYTTLRNSFREEEEINDIIELELMNQRSELSIILNGWRTVLQSKLGNDLYSAVLKEFDQMEKHLDQQIEKSRGEIIEQIKKKTKFKIGSKTSESPAFITESIKGLLIHLPRANKEEILNYLKSTL